MTTVDDPFLGRPPAGGPDAPALHCPDEPFPPYRFVPGKSPHPFAHEGGWGRGLERSVLPFLARDAWETNAAYLCGIDFFNRGWWWEAHEVWEELWHVVEGKDAVQHDLLKGLIQLAACALNRERASDSGAARLLGTACNFLQRAEDASSPRLMGLDLPALRDEARRRLDGPIARVDGFYLLPVA